MREDAIAEARTAHGVSKALVHHTVYSGRPSVRSAGGARLAPDSSGEIAWAAVERVEPGPQTAVFDVATGDPAQAFVAGGVVVHNCGNKAARTDLTRADLDALGGVEPVMGEIARRISFGMGVPARERVDHPVHERIRNADFAPQRKLAQLAESQLGTVRIGQPLRQPDGGR